MPLPSQGPQPAGEQVPDRLDPTEDNANGSDGGKSELEFEALMKEVIKSGRGIRRLVTLAGTIQQLVKENDQRLLGERDGESEGSEDEDAEIPRPPLDPQELQRRHDRDWRSFRALVKLVPGLKQKICEPKRSARALYYSWLIYGANASKSDDISRVKPKIAEWINARPGVTDKQRLVLFTRVGRGLQHDLTGKLLCPIKYDWDDLSVRAKVRDEVDGYSASSDYWLRCLYEGEEGDPEDVEKGFLKSRLLVRTFKLIFTSPSSAEEGHSNQDIHPQWHKSKVVGPPKRPNNAEKLGMDGSITPRAIAYTAVQLHFALTDATCWANQYNGFDYEEFWEFIVDFFEADQTVEAQEASAKLLEWWNREVFPRSPATRAAAPTSTRRTCLGILRQQRQAARSSHPPS